MKNPRIMTKVITGVLAGGMILSAGSIAFAKSDNASDTNKSTSNITQKKDYKKFNRQKHGFPEEAMIGKLDSLVKAGTITQKQADTIKDYLTKKQNEMKAEFDKIKNMTETEREAYFKANKPKEKMNFLKDLVDQKVITQEQADAIEKTMPKMQRPDKDHFKSQLDSQVKAGVITQAEEDKIIAFMEQNRPKIKEDMTKVKDMTKEQRDAYFKDKKAEPKQDIFAEMVKQGIISQSKADTLKKAIPEVHKDKPFIKR